jgi:hypothetical protein
MPKLRPTMQFLITLSAMVVALYLIVSPATSAEARTWAQSVMTGLFGYWLRGR